MSPVTQRSSLYEEFQGGSLRPQVNAAFLLRSASMYLSIRGIVFSIDFYCRSISESVVVFTVTDGVETLRL